MMYSHDTSTYFQYNCFFQVEIRYLYNMNKSPAYLGPAPADTYLLKSLDTFDFDGLNGKERLAVIPCGGR